MWTLSLPWWEFVLRALIVYVFLLILLRFTGKRQVGQLTPFDLVVLLVLGNAVQNAMNGGDNTILAGIILSATIISLDLAVAWLTFKSKRLERLVEGRPIVLIHSGVIIPKALDEAKITHHDLNASLRAAGCTTPDEVLVAVLENSGRISVIPKRWAEQPR